MADGLADLMEYFVDRDEAREDTSAKTLPT